MSVKNLRLKKYVCSILAAAAVSSVAIAQEKVTLLEEIVVTAQKRSESLQDVAIAISAFTDKTRDLVGITTVQDFTNYTPGVSYSASLDRMTIRGIGRNSNNLLIDPSVATYGDGFYNSSNHQADGTPLFIERVEILRGPQGTLYGRNSIGGTLNVLSKRPSDEFSGEVRADFGNYQKHDIEGNFSGALTDWMKIMVGGGNYRQDNGFNHNVGGQDEWGVRDNTFAQAQLSIKIGDAADIWIKYVHTDWDEGYGGSFGVSNAPYVTNNACPPACSAVAGVGSLILPNTGALGPNFAFNTGTNLIPASPAWTNVNPRLTDPRAVDHDTPA